MKMTAKIALLLAMVPGISNASNDYISWSIEAVRNSMIASATQDGVRVCLSGQVTQADFERSAIWARRAILTWFRVAKLIDKRVTNRLEFNCEDHDIIFYLRNGAGTSYASPRQVNIYMTRPYGTWTHELGHALAGLNDTYAGKAGQCYSSQPESLMCWGAYGPRIDSEVWSSLWPDDIEGMRANYLKVFPGELVAPDWASEINLESPLQTECPWPSECGYEPIDRDLVDVRIVPGGPTPIDYDNTGGSIDR